ncbi:MAG: hypothetical protein PHH58_16275 [Rhodoferax sp.]|nr:hypothetical protein [Rhodoferax sp.]
MVLDDIHSRDLFLSQLDWLLALEQRYENIMQAGLVHVTYNTRDVQNLTFDARDTAIRLGEVLVCLKKAFRSTDLMTREGMSFWILTPFTQLDPVADKVRHVLKYAPENGLAIASSQIRIYLLRDHVKKDLVHCKRAEDFLSYLRDQPASADFA